MGIDEFLQTSAGAKALKAKLKSLPAHEKTKPGYDMLWKKACDVVDRFNLEKMQKQSKEGDALKDVPKDKD